MDDYRQVTDDDLSRGYWWLKHKTLAIKIAWALGIIILLWLYAGLFLGINKYAGGQTLEQQSMALSNNFDWATYHGQRHSQSIQVSGTEFFAVNSRLYNLVAAVNNPNQDWFVSQLDYRFVVDGKPLDAQSTFLNPGENKLLLRLGYQAARAIKNLEIEVLDTAWQRFDNSAPMINWGIEDASFHPATTQTIDDQIIDLPERVTWQARNLSLFNLWTASWQIALYNRDRLVAVNQIIAEDFAALENRELEAVWLYDLPQVTKVEVIPHVNWLDRDNFKASESGDNPDEDRVNL
jgi:hypothetical protein